MPLQSKFKTRTEIPVEHLPFYTEREGAWVLDVEDMVAKSKLDEVRATNVSLLKERDELKQRFEGIDPDGGPYPQQWSVAGRTNTVLAVSGLMPGRYYFIAQAVSVSNVWSDASNQIEVSIPEPPRLIVVEPPSLLLTGVVYRATNVLGPWKELVRLPPVAVPADSGDGYFRLGLEWGRFGGN